MARPKGAISSQILPDGTKLRKCCECGKWKELSEFSKKEYRCYPCNRIHSRIQRHKTLSKLWLIKTLNGCADCGYNEHPVALQFDHLPEFEKKFELSRADQYTWEETEAELAKCEVVCANCHAIRTFNRKAEEYA